MSNVQLKFIYTCTIMKTIGEKLTDRLGVGMERYGHGVIVNSDTREWGTPANSWMQMAEEEFLDGIIYMAADYIRQGRETEAQMSNLEREYNSETTSDDNGLIMYVVNNFNDMESLKHKKMLNALFYAMLC